MLVKAGLRNLLRNPRRTLGVVVAVALGTGSLFLVHGFNAGIMNQYRYNAVHGIFGDGEVRTPGYGDRVWEKPWEHWIAEPAAVERDLGAVPGVSALFPRVSFQALLSAGDHTAVGGGIGVEGVREATYFTTVNVEEGADLGDKDDGIVLGRELARALGVRVGDRVTVLAPDVHGSTSGDDFHVTGIFHTGKLEIDGSVFKVQLARAQRLLDTDRVERVVVGLGDGATFANVAARFAAEKKYEAVSFEELDAAEYGNTVRFLDQQFQIIRLVVLAVVLLGLGSVLAASVFERRAEIGTLRANGESRSDVLKLVAIESGAMGLLGGLAGVLYALGVVRLAIPDGVLMPAAPGLTRQFLVRVELQPWMALEVSVLGVVIVLAAASLAARRVLRAPVSELLRSA